MIFESENIEYKSQMTDDIYREMIAFANADNTECGYDRAGSAASFQGPLL